MLSTYHSSASVNSSPSSPNNPPDKYNQIEEGTLDVLTPETIVARRAKREEFAQYLCPIEWNKFPREYIKSLQLEAYRTSGPYQRQKYTPRFHFGFFLSDEEVETFGRKFGHEFLSMYPNQGYAYGRWRRQHTAGDVLEEEEDDGYAEPGSDPNLALYITWWLNRKLAAEKLAMTVTRGEALPGAENSMVCSLIYTGAPDTWTNPEERWPDEQSLRRAEAICQKELQTEEKAMWYYDRIGFSPALCDWKLFDVEKMVGRELLSQIDPDWWSRIEASRAEEVAEEGKKEGMGDDDDYDEELFAKLMAICASYASCSTET